MEEMEYAFMVLGGFLILLLIMLLILSIVLYVLHSIGLYTLAKNEGLDKLWLAFVPLFSVYTLGELVSKTRNGKVGLYLVIISLIYTVVVTILSFVQGALIDNTLLYISVSGIICILALGICIVLYYFYYKLFKMYTNNAVLLTVLGVILGNLVLSIAVFVIRNKKRIDKSVILESTEE